MSMQHIVRLGIGPYIALEVEIIPQMITDYADCKRKAALPERAKDCEGCSMNHTLEFNGEALCEMPVITEVIEKLEEDPE